MFKSEILIWEFKSIDRFSSSSVVICEISSLSHEISDDTMEMRIFIAESF